MDAILWAYAWDMIPDSTHTFLAEEALNAPVQSLKTFIQDTGFLEL